MAFQCCYLSHIFENDNIMYAQNVSMEFSVCAFCLLYDSNESFRKQNENYR